VRKLGSGTRADVFLGVGDAAEPPAAVAIKLFHSSTDTHSIASEVAVLAQATSAHCVRLLDFSTDNDGHAILVLSRAQRGSVARLLALRQRIEVGEAVTIVAPIAGVVDDLAVAGIVHSRISAATVHFGDRGEPVLLGFGHGQVLDSPAKRASGALEIDRERLAVFASFVLAAVQPDDDSGTASPGVERLVEWIETSPRPLPPGFAAELQSRLFDLGPASAVSFEPRGPRGHSSAQRAHSTSPAVRRAPGVPAAPEAPAASASGLSRWVDVALGASPLAPLRSRLQAALRTRLPAAVRAVRPRFWVTVAISVLALLVAVLVAPRGVDVADAPGASTTEPGSPAEGDDPAAGAASTPGASGEPVAGEPENGDVASGLPEDPLAALPLLLVERARCFADLSALCLAEVDQTDSAISTEDTALILQPQSAAKNTADGAAVVNGRALEEPFEMPEGALVERLGDAALVQFTTNGKPASVLMIRTEAGWRLREIYGAVAATS
jgi:hypothetical protein